MDPLTTPPADYDHYSDLSRATIDYESEAQDWNQPTSSESPIRTCFRLVVKSSSVLARKKRIAVLDTYVEVQIGRDASLSEVTPRIRLKDMEVSKLHATVFWDQERKEWAIVDMGSKHGTFVKSVVRHAPSTDETHALERNIGNGIHGKDVPLQYSDPSFVRLSPARKSSLPRMIRHSDELSIGTTVFVVHVHANGIPCEDCFSEGGVDIPLFSGQSQKRIMAQVEAEPSRTPRDAKSAISFLKRSLLTRLSNDSGIPAETTSPSYIDRSAKRRALHPYSRSGSPPPGAQSRSRADNPVVSVTTYDTATSSDTLRIAYASSSDIASSAPAVPISDANIGHRLLAKQGWVPGSTLGVSTLNHGPSVAEEGVHSRSVEEARIALTEPLQLAVNVGRQGLGMRMRAESPVQAQMEARWPKRRQTPRR